MVDAYFNNTQLLNSLKLYFGDKYIFFQFILLLNRLFLRIKTILLTLYSDEMVIGLEINKGLQINDAKIFYPIKIYQGNGEAL